MDCFPSGSKETDAFRLSVMLIGDEMKWGKCLHLTLSPPFSDSVKVGTDIKKKKKKWCDIAVLVLAEDWGA